MSIALEYQPLEGLQDLLKIPFPPFPGLSALSGDEISHFLESV